MEHAYRSPEESDIDRYVEMRIVEFRIERRNARGRAVIGCLLFGAAIAAIAANFVSSTVLFSSIGGIGASIVVNVLIDFAMERRDENQLRAYLRRIHRGAS